MVKKKRIRLRGRTRTARMMGVAVKLIFHVLRFVEFKKQEGTPGLMIYHTGRTPIRSAAKMGPFASRTQSKTALS